MVFSKHLYFVVLGYILAILVVAGAGIVLVITHTAFILGSLLVVISFFIIESLTRRLNKFNTRVRAFLDTIEDGENMILFSEHTADKEMNTLARSLNRVSNLFATRQSHSIQQEKFYHTILEEVPDGVLAWNAEKKILFANGAALYLLGMEQCLFLYQLEKKYPSLKKFIASENWQESFLLQSDSQKQLSLSMNQMKLDAKQITLLSIRNISHELSDKESESWNKLTRVLTHEIMNTIAPIVSLSQTLSSYPNTDDRLAHGLKVIREQSERLMEFTESYRYLSYMPEPKKKVFSLTGLLQELSFLLQSDFESSNIRFILRSTLPEVSFYGDKRQLSQVFLNLLKNSIQSLDGETNGLIEISLDVTDKLYIRLLDNGCGIPVELQEKIFVPFFTTKKEGMGIGLSLCRQIVKKHGGSIVLEESRKGKTMFVIAFASVDNLFS